MADEGFDQPDEALYRSYSTWELEQIRKGLIDPASRDVSPDGHVYNLPDGYYETRLALIDQLLAERKNR